MPIAAMATFRGRVQSSSPPASITLTGRPAGEPVASFTGAVSREVVEAVDGDLLFYGLRVVLDGEEVPAGELVGDFEVEESIDSPRVTFAFTLAGLRWLPLATSRVWSRTPVEVYTASGKTGSMREELRAFGYVITCQLQDDLTVRVSCGDPSMLYDRFELCHEVPPFSGLTRGDVCREIVADAGILDTDIPSGAFWEKPWVSDSRTLWDALSAFGEPEGWHWRFREGGVLEAYTARLKAEPEAPDHVWAESGVASVDTSPPSDVPSRWVVRGTAMVSIDEMGVKTRVTRTEVQALYAPKAAASRQQSDGDVEDAGLSEEPEGLRTISIVEDQVVERGGLTVLQLTREWGWFNPLAAKLRTPFAGEPQGPVEDGYYPARAWIDADGAYRAWPREAFVLTGERRQIPTYDANGTLVSSRTEVSRWHSRTMGVKHTAASILDIAGVGVGGDDQSYFPFETALVSLLRIEGYGLAEVTETVYAYSEAGAVREETQDVYRWYSPRTAVEGNPWFLTYAGTGQLELTAPWRLYRRQVTTNVISDDGLLLGKIEVSLGYGAAKRIGGPHDYGDFKSNSPAEQWRPLRRVNTAYNALSEDSYEEVVEDADGVRTPRLISGRLPLPRYQASSWTRMTQAPLELVLDDPAARDWFAGPTEILQSEFIQNLAEAQRVALARRGRALCFSHEVTRPRTLARPGDTVLLEYPLTGIAHRCLVTRRKETWTLAPRTSILGVYTLEQPL